MGIYSIATFIPEIALIIRRLHDIDRNGCWFFLYLIPVAGQIVFFIMLSRQSVSYEVYPGMSGSGPYTDPLGRNSGGRPNDPYWQSRQPYAWPQYPYAPPPYSQQQNPYAPPPYGQQRSPYAPPPYGQQQNPYAPSSYGEPKNPYAPPPSEEPENPYAPPPVEQSQNPDTLPYTQDNIRPQNPYIPPPHAQPQNPYAGHYYPQQFYGPPPWYQRPLPKPRRYAPPAGSGDAIIAFIISIILAAAYYGNSIVSSVYLNNNIDRYINAIFENILPGYDYSYPYDSFSHPFDYGYGDEDGNYGDGYGYNDGGAGNGMTDEEQAAVDLVRESALSGFPEFTIEEVLLAQVDGDGLVWDCFLEGYEENSSHYITAKGYIDGTFYYLFAGFDVYEDGSIELYNLDDGIRDEYYEDAVRLYKEWYDRMLSGGGNSAAA